MFLYQLFQEFYLIFVIRMNFTCFLPENINLFLKKLDNSNICDII